MRDHVTFPVAEPLPGLPVGNFAGYIDHVYLFSEDRQLPFPHMRATPVTVRCVLTIERDIHPVSFDRASRLNRRDVDVTDLVQRGALRYDQHLVPDVLKKPRS